ncbi:universal stress protein [Nocardioides sp.]|uniref:universal stress protein n=1 Tax=Nocardioides sp. TaxID=35761 RepID=UPI002ED10359
MTVLVGYIPDQYGEAALAAAIEEADRRGTDLLVLNASRGDALVDKRYLGESQLGDLERRLADSGVAHEIRQSVGSDAADELVAAAGVADDPVIVIGMRHRTPVGKLIMGSTAQRILLDAPCWVIAVKP